MELSLACKYFKQYPFPLPGLQMLKLHNLLAQHASLILPLNAEQGFRETSVNL